MKHILIGKNIFKSFDNEEKKVSVLNDVNIAIESGEFLTVMGPSGSGKSTLLYSVSGMDSIDSGQVLFCGTDLSTLKDDEMSEIRRSKMGFIFQHPTMLKNLNIIDNITLPAMKGENSKKEEIIDKAKTIMKRIGISELENREISKVSGGQLQRASICRALITDPLIIFGDEPTGALNSKNTEEIIKILKDINSSGTTIMLVTHDPKVAKISHRVLFMKDGQIADEAEFLGKSDDEREQILLEKMRELNI
ncbi:ABC transporter, ATP-binding protein [Peptoniphilus sp. ING2-D1G]|nr:ABC transporter, ATP-binding protein [Peptoniphilus sp. ING2-D1G]